MNANLGGEDTTGFSEDDVVEKWVGVYGKGDNVFFG